VKRVRVERGIYRQTNGCYGVYVMIGGKPRYQSVGYKLTHARRQRDLLATKARSGELAVPVRLTFGQLAAEWIAGFEAQVVAGERGERTLENYTYHLNKHLLPTFGRRRIQDINADDCARLIATLRTKGYAAKTINGALVPLSRVLALALRRGHINDNPLSRLDQSERPRVHKRNQRVLSHDEIAGLLEASLPTYRPLLATAIYTGMRLSELLGLTWGDIDLQGGLIHVRQQLSRATRDRPARRVRLKTPASTRDIPLLPQLGALLKRHKLATPYSTDGDYVFTTGVGTPHSARNVERRGLRHAAQQAGINHEDQPALRVHDLRHTFASHLIIDLKLDPAHVSRILGHNRPSITLDLYTHLFHHATHTTAILRQMADSQFGALLTPAATEA
jgi:integrase